MTNDLSSKVKTFLQIKMKIQALYVPSILDKVMNKFLVIRGCCRIQRISTNHSLSVVNNTCQTPAIGFHA